jgi:hypothetical protein
MGSKFDIPRIHIHRAPQLFDGKSRDRMLVGVSFQVVFSSFFFLPRRDYDDHQVNCGGLEEQYERWGGRCGTCGDSWGLPRPRPHEQGGQFGEGILARNYTQGQVGGELSS